MRARAFTAGPRGVRARGGGHAAYPHTPPAFRGTTVQVCGLWPFATGVGAPMVGVPLGRHMTSGGMVCCDPISWFQRAGLINTPSVFIEALPARGKSALCKRMVLGLAARGVLPCVLGDLKGEYVPAIRALNGQVITLGRGAGYWNVLDASDALTAADRLTGRARAGIIADARGRRITMLAALITLASSRPPTDHQETLLDRAITILDRRHTDPPVLENLIAVLNEAPDELRQVTFDRGDLNQYYAQVDDLLRTLTGLLGHGRIGEMFSQPTTDRMLRDRPVVFDISSIDDGDTSLKAAALLACWSAGFGAVRISGALADAGLEPAPRMFLVCDELWQTLRGGRGMVDRVDALTRLDRHYGVGTAMITHTLSDMLALPDAADIAKARGLAERAGMVIAGGLPVGEMDLLTKVTPLSDAEQRMLVSWQDPPSWDSDTERETAPPGRGKFLIKVGGRPGIPIQTYLTRVELELSDTNQAWR